MKSLSCVQLFATPWTVAHQAPPSVEFSRQEYWSGLSFPSPGDLPDLGIEPRSPTLKADALPSEPPGKSIYIHIHSFSLLSGIPVYDYFITYLFISYLQTFRLFRVFVIINTQAGTSLIVQWLRFLTPSAGHPRLIPDQGTPNEDQGFSPPQLRLCSQIHIKK